MTTLLAMRDGRRNVLVSLIAVPHDGGQVRLLFRVAAPDRTEEEDLGIEATDHATEILDLVEGMRERFAAQGFVSATDVVQ